MTRLFASLFFVVVVGIVATGWLSEKIWQLYEQKNQPSVSASNHSDIAQLAQITKLIPLQLNQVPAHLQQHQLEQVKQLFSQEYNASIRLISIDDVAWPNALLADIHAGNAQLSFTDNQQLIIHLPWLAQKKLIVIGPIQLSNKNHNLKQLFQLVAYLLLALIILAWTWPLWRDLRKLQRASIAYAKGDFNHHITVNTSSAVKPLAISFQTMAQQISTLVDEQKQLVNTVSHDLRTPLSRIKFSLAMLPEHVQALLPEMKKDLNALEHLVDELLSYARLEHQSQCLTLDNVDIKQLLGNQVAQNQQHHNIHIALQCPEHLNWCCDGHLIERVIQNILSNALRFAEQKISVLAEIKNQQLRINITDDGIGINKQDIETVFTPFTRLDNNHKKSNGFGLGLAIVRKICRWHGGDCFISSEIEEDIPESSGATFIITLPYKKL